jgi:hypothetical protein
MIGAPALQFHQRLSGSNYFMYCPSCACALPAVAKFCVRCGAPTGFALAAPAMEPDVTGREGPAPAVRPGREGPQTYCGKCGSAVDQRCQFCSACGNPLSADAAPGPAPLRTHPITGAAATAASPIASEGSSESRGARFPKTGNSYSNTQAKGSHFVIPPGGLLPNRCVKCGAAPTEPWLELTFSWHHPGLFLLLISPILYLIISLIVAKKVTLAVPLCTVHKQIRKKRLWTGWLLLIACIPVPVALAVYIGNDAAETLAVWLGIALSLCGIGFLRAARPIRATEIGPASAEFAGACPDFLDAMEQAPAP